MTLRILILTASLASALASAAPACSLCDSKNARTVRENVAGDVTPRTLAAVAVPFVVVAGVVSFVHFGGAPASRRRRR